MKLLEKLVKIRATSGDESKMTEFILNYIKSNSKNWKVKPKIFYGDGFQDAIVLVFGKPSVAVYAHIDSIGFTVGYNNNLIPIGGPRIIDGCKLVGEDSKGKIETELMVIENEEGDKNIQAVYKRQIDRGTNLTFKPKFKESENYIQSPYMDNRLGVWVALNLTSTLENGAIVFSTYEEHRGGSAGFLAKLLLNKYKVRQALVCDITWVTDGVSYGKGVAL